MKSPLIFAWLNSTTVVEHRGWLLLHSLWQFALVVFLAGATVRAMRRNSAELRYVVLVSAMGVSVGLPVATWFFQRGNQPDQLTSSEMAAVRSLTDAGANPRIATNALFDHPLVLRDAQRERPTPRLNQPIMPRVAQREGPAHSPVAKLMTTSKAPVPIPVESEPAPSRLEQAAEVLRPWLVWIVAGWSLGVVLCSLRPLLGWHTLRRLRHTGVSPVPDEVPPIMSRLSQRLGLRRTVQVLQSTLTHGPVVVGYLRPVILLPVSLVTSIPGSQLEMILLHELAHVRRHDFMINLLQVLIETLFFYHPAIWWLSRRIRTEREHCCDDLVVSLLGNGVEYGRALLAVEELRGRSAALALGAADGPLLTRVRRIVGGTVLGVSIVCAVLATLAMRIGIEAAEPPQTNRAVVQKHDANRSSESKPRKTAGEPALKDEPVAKELQPFQGTWAFDACEFEKWYTPLKEIHETWKWAIAAVN
jgi:beta-lactamase regulating signal transducer with metallopeptidase domain